MDVSPFQAAAVGFLIVAGGTLLIGLSDPVARKLHRGDAEARVAFRERCRSYTLWLLVGAVVLALAAKVLA